MLRAAAVVDLDKIERGLDVVLDREAQEAAPPPRLLARRQPPAAHSVVDVPLARLERARRRGEHARRAVQRAHAEARRVRAIRATPADAALAEPALGSANASRAARLVGGAARREPQRREEAGGGEARRLRARRHVHCLVEVVRLEDEAEAGRGDERGPGQVAGTARHAALVLGLGLAAEGGDQVAAGRVAHNHAVSLPHKEARESELDQLRRRARGNSHGGRPTGRLGRHANLCRRRQAHQADVLDTAVVVVDLVSGRLHRRRRHRHRERLQAVLGLAAQRRCSPRRLRRAEHEPLAPQVGRVRDAAGGGRAVCEGGRLTLVEHAQRRRAARCAGGGRRWVSGRQRPRRCRAEHAQRRRGRRDACLQDVGPDGRLEECAGLRQLEPLVEVARPQLAQQVAAVRQQGGHRLLLVHKGGGPREGARRRLVEGARVGERELAARELLRRGEEPRLVELRKRLAPVGQGGPVQPDRVGDRGEERVARHHREAGAAALARGLGLAQALLHISRRVVALGGALAHLVLPAVEDEVVRAVVVQVGVEKLGRAVAVAVAGVRLETVRDTVPVGVAPALLNVREPVTVRVDPAGRGDGGPVGVEDVGQAVIVRVLVLGVGRAVAVRIHAVALEPVRDAVPVGVARALHSVRQTVAVRVSVEVVGDAVAVCVVEVRLEPVRDAVAVCVCVALLCVRQPVGICVEDGVRVGGDEPLGRLGKPLLPQPGRVEHRH